MRRLLGSLLVSVVLLAGCGSGDGSGAEPEATPAPAPARIKVHASGVTRGVPDLLTVSLGVQTRAATASAALDDNNQRAADLLRVLQERGAAGEDVQTSQVSVHQSYDNRGRINGFVVDNVVTARLRDLAKAGELLDAVAGVAGDAVRVHGLSFSIEDPAGVAEEARTDAVRRARRQAEQLAEAAGVELGALRSMHETPPAGVSWEAARTTGYDDASASAVPLAPGSQEVRVEVELVYEVAA